MDNWKILSGGNERKWVKTVYFNCFENREKLCLQARKKPNGKNKVGNKSNDCTENWPLLLSGCRSIS